MSAVRMVAYGVLELKQPKQYFWLGGGASVPTNNDEDSRANEQLHKLVREELHNYGLALLQNTALHYTRGRHRKTENYVLCGQRQGTPKFSARSTLYTGSFKDCCIEAAKLLDQLDAAQIPDTATGNE